MDIVWGNERPSRPRSQVFYLDLKYSGWATIDIYFLSEANADAGESHLSKIKRVREELVKKKAKATVLTMLDEVAWLFNLRGADIDFNPHETPVSHPHSVTGQ